MARYRWDPSDGHPPLCAATHGPHGGWLDESARRLSHEELEVARQLAAEGHRVRACPERRGGGKTPDMEACGSPVEVKSFLRLPEREGRSPTSRSVFNKLVQAEQQGHTVVILARQRGLSAVSAQEGVAAYEERTGNRRMQAIRVIGDGFDLSWRRQLELVRRAAPSPHQERRSHPDLGLTPGCP